MLMRILMLMARSSAWSPASLFANGEQGVWYDPSDMSTLFQDSAGTIPVTAVGQPVGLILDKSGRGNHARQATVAKRPILKIDGNGKYYLKFDGVDDGMQTGNIDFTGTDKMTVWAGVRKLSDASRGLIVELGNNSTRNFIFDSGYSSDRDLRIVMFGDGLTANPEYYYNKDAPVTAVMCAIINRKESNSLILRYNSIANGSFINQYTLTDTFNVNPLYIGSRGGTSLPFNGHIYSLIVRGAQSSEAQILSAETYCNQKTGAY